MIKIIYLRTRCDIFIYINVCQIFSVKFKFLKSIVFKKNEPFLKRNNEPLFHCSSIFQRTQHYAGYLVG